MKYLLIVLILMAGCSPIKQMQRLVKKHPELIKSDIIVVRDTVVTAPIFKTDTFVTNERDTVRIDTGRLHVRVIRSLDTLYVEGICDADTVYMAKDVIVEKVVPCPEGYNQRVAKWWKVAALICGGFLLFIFVMLTRKR